MLTLTRIAGLVLVVAAGLSHAPAAHAGFVYVASYGDDAGTCGAVYEDPCATLQRGVDLASPGDTVFIEFFGNYGPATIAKALNIVAAVPGGVYTPAGVPCLTINAGANDVVSVVGLICDQAGTANEGIVFNSGRRLRLRDVDFVGGGGGACAVRFRPTNNAEIDFSNIALRGWGAGACLVPRAGADVSGTIENVELLANQTGLFAAAGAGSIISVTCDACEITGGALASIRTARLRPFASRTAWSARTRSA